MRGKKRFLHTSGASQILVQAPAAPCAATSISFEDSDEFSPNHAGSGRERAFEVRAGRAFEQDDPGQTQSHQQSAHSRGGGGRQTKTQ